MTAVRYAGLSDAGKKHPANDDRWHVAQDLGLALVTDGMGEPVSPQFVVEVLPQIVGGILPRGAPLTDADVRPKVQGALAALNHRVRKEAAARGEITGTTLVLAIIREAHVLVAHVGDSRAYRLRNGRLEQLTVDHSYLQHMVDQGWLTAEEAAERQGNGGPTRFFGIPAELEGDVAILDWQTGDRLLLCSDGVTEMLTREMMQTSMINATDPEAACRALVDAALQAGGRDNVTAVVAFAEDFPNRDQGAAIP